jgi:hypothetical protein
MKVTMKMKFHALALSALAASNTLWAQDAPPQLDKVTVERHGASSVAPYAGINGILAGLERHGEGLFRFEFRLKSKDPKKALVSPRLALQHADFYRPLAVQSDGLIELPILPPEQAKEAEIVTNQPKGTMSAQGSLLLTINPGELDMATVRRVVAVSRRLRSELLPWYARWLFPHIVGVRVCSVKADWELRWRDKGQLWGLPLPADGADTDPDAESGQAPRVCTTMTGQESWPDEARLVAPADAKLSVRLQ